MQWMFVVLLRTSSTVRRVKLANPPDRPNPAMSEDPGKEIQLQIYYRDNYSRLRSHDPGPRNLPTLP
jgi:hypothetical protein